MLGRHVTNDKKRKQLKVSLTQFSQSFVLSLSGQTEMNI